MQALQFLAAVLAGQITLASSQQSFGDVAVGGCKTFNVTATVDAILTIRQFSTHFDTTECMQMTVSAYDKTSSVWSIVCEADMRGGGSNNVTVIPESACVPFLILPGETATFRLEYAACSDSCTAPCDCEVTPLEEPLGRLDRYYDYIDQLCSADGTCEAAETLNSPSAMPSTMPSAVPTGNPPAPVNTTNPEPLKMDSDGDGVSDAEEQQIGTNPLSPDSDNDGFSDAEELMADTDPLNATDTPPPGAFLDSDSNGISDAVEAALIADMDGDGVVDSVEESIGTDALNPDSDNDGVSDGEELLLGFDPLNATDTPPPGAFPDSNSNGISDAVEAALDSMSSNPSSGASDPPSMLPSSRPSSDPSSSNKPTTKTASPTNSRRPSEMPSVRRSESPSSSPSDSMSSDPSSRASDQPSMLPSSRPSSDPSSPNKPTTKTASPTNSRRPSEMPSVRRSESPSSSPSSKPSSIPSQSPSDRPTGRPTTSSPVAGPTTTAPTFSPVVGPTTKKPTDVPTSMPTDLPSTIPSSLPSLVPSGSPSETPSSAPSSRPSRRPSLRPVNPVKTLPPATSPPTSRPSLRPITGNPTFMPTPPVTDAPTLFPTTPNPPCGVAEYDPLTGNMIKCGVHSDCGGSGATCNADCKCDCPASSCLVSPSGNGDIACEFACDCAEACDVGHTKSKASDGCTLQCTSCLLILDDGTKILNSTLCGRDQDCVVDDVDNPSEGFCVGSGLCTASKAAMCDDAYTAMSGSPNQRAKCCPATSGCIKSAMGVILTSSCGAVCGNSCLTAQDNPGNFGESPATFCTFGSRVENMPYCPDLAEAGSGEFSCTGDKDTEGDNSICCTHLSDGTEIDGIFSCTDVTYGYEDEPVCVDADSLTGITGRILPICQAV